MDKDYLSLYILKTPIEEVSRVMVSKYYDDIVRFLKPEKPSDQYFYYGILLGFIRYEYDACSYDGENPISLNQMRTAFISEIRRHKIDDLHGL